MKVAKSRKHHINMGPYEHLEILAYVEDDIGNKPGDLELALIRLDEALDVLTYPDLDDARVHTAEESSYVHPYLDDLQNRSTTRGTNP